MAKENFDDITAEALHEFLEKDLPKIFPKNGESYENTRNLMYENQTVGEWIAENCQD